MAPDQTYVAKDLLTANANKKLPKTECVVVQEAPLASSVRRINTRLPYDWRNEAGVLADGANRGKKVQMANEVNKIAGHSRLEWPASNRARV
ncbi:uncharacterized protein G2W53_038455 [Senna tora]|uniref:Uncharacterized protein n=1 Tax=Senna tora TaxID=362788 RepID=A0A834SZF6_9FABA|nr:uncharacterized protein G2W53_038455 [Senna tora]